MANGFAGCCLGVFMMVMLIVLIGVLFVSAL